MAKACLSLYGLTPFFFLILIFHRAPFPVLSQKAFIFLIQRVKCLSRRSMGDPIVC